MKRIRKIVSRKKAQAAIELAIFGGILVFVLGLIVRQAVSSNLAHDYTLKAMRLALSMSLKTGLGMDSQQLGGGGACAARTSASVFFIEDRLAPTADKYGPRSRMPFVATGGGSYTNTLFIPFDEMYHDNIPRFDLIVNGQHFIFTLGGFNVYDKLTDETRYPEIPWLQDCMDRPGFWDCNWNIALNMGDGGWETGNNYTPPDTRPCRIFYKIIENIPQEQEPTTADEIRKEGVFCDHDDAPEVESCTDNPPDAQGPMNLTADERFDLDRNMLTLGDRIPAAPPRLRQRFRWQWFAVMGVDLTRSRVQGCAGGHAGQISRPQTYYYSPTKYFASVVLYKNPEEDWQKTRNVSVDVDGDRKPERIIKILEVETAPGVGNTGRLEKLLVFDSQEGDMDMGFDARSQGPEPGLQDSIQMFSRTNSGTYLLLEDGALLDPQTRATISTQKRDRVDLVQRAFQLSRDTGNLCGNGMPFNVEDYEPHGSVANILTINPRAPPNTPLYAHWDVEKSRPNVNRNPKVETCACQYGYQNFYYTLNGHQQAGTPNCGPNAHASCFEAATIDTTCFDEDSRMLYVRSRIEDIGGSKWKTRLDLEF